MSKTAHGESHPEAGLAGIVSPMRESFERARQVSDRLHSTFADIFTSEINFLQENALTTIAEFHDLAGVRGPAEFFELANQFAWQQTEHSLKAFGELGVEMCSCWLEALTSAPIATAGKASRRRAS